MASDDERKINEFLQNHGLQETFITLEQHISSISGKQDPVTVRTLLANLKENFLKAFKDPKMIFTAITAFLDLLSKLLPFPFSTVLAITAVAINGLLILFKVLSKQSSKIKAFEQPDFLDENIQRKAYAVQGALSSSLRFLQGIHQRKLNDEEFDILQNQVPRETGTEFLGELKYKMQEFQTGNPNNLHGKKAEKETNETEKETFKRCNYAIALCDMYCFLSTLREFVMNYYITILSNNKVSEEITKSYLKRREIFKTEREEILKVLYEPEPKDAGIAAVFEPSKWPKLREQLNSRPDFSQVIGRPLKIVSVSNKEFEVFRYSPEITKFFILTRYVRVMKKSGTKFVLKSEGNQDFTIHLSEKPEITWNIKGDEVQATQTKPSDPSDLSDHFNIVRLSNGNFMFSSRARPTCFIKMEKAQNDARLTVVNNGFEESCQWKMET